MRIEFYGLTLFTPMSADVFRGYKNETLACKRANIRFGTLVHAIHFFYVHETYRHIDAVIYFKNKKNLTHLPKQRIYLPGLVLINMMQKL